MKNLGELTDFYYDTLYPTLKKLEKNRKNVRYKIMLLASIVFFVTLLILYKFKNSLSFDLEIIMFIGFIYFAIGTFIYKFLIKDYTKEFKNRIIKPLINEIDENLNYTPSLHVSQRLFEKSKLFISKPDEFSGNDFVQGKIDAIPIQFSDIHAQKEDKFADYDESKLETIFQGLFIVAEFNKHFQAQTIILADLAQNTFGDLIGSWLQSKNVTRDTLVKMDNVEFEKEFVVYSTDQVEARYILSHSLMQRLLDFKKKSSHPVHISFIDKSIHIAVEYNKDLFEPSIFHSLLNHKVAMEYIQTLHLAIGIIHELKLNQKLWSKQ